MVWKLAIGLPAAQHHQTPLSSLFERLGRAAWTIAGVTSDVAESVISPILTAGAQKGAVDQDLEVSVVPEIAAQIYGFVASNNFDKKEFVDLFYLFMSNLQVSSCTHISSSNPSTDELRSLDNANVIVLEGDHIGPDAAWLCLQTFLTTPFDGGRHTARVTTLG